MITLHITAILVAALVSFVIGWLWYSPYLFQKAWMRMAQIPTQTATTAPMLSLLGAGFATYVILAGVMDVLFQIIGVGTLDVALKLATLFWFGFVATLTLGMVTWERKPFQLYLLNNGYHLVSFLVTALMLMVLR